MKNKYALAVNSLLILLSTSLIATLLHESAHYFTGLYFHIPSEMHHNYVRPLSEGTPEQMVSIAGAGPVFSLILGLVITYIAFRISKASLFKLFMLWLGMENILMFLGYLLIAPIAKSGDTGKVFAYLGIPLPVAIGIAVVSVIVTSKLFRTFASQFAYYKHDTTFDKQENTKQLFVLPIIGCIVLGTLLNLPVFIWVSLLPTIFMPMSFFSTMGGYKKLSINDAELVVNKLSPWLIVVTVVVIGVFRYLV